MFNRRYVAVLALASSTVIASTQANDVRFYQENGVTYQETRRMVDRPVVDVQMQQHTETVYRYERKTETRESINNLCLPVTTYYLEPRVHGWWNPLKPNTIVYRWVPRTVWQRHTQKVGIPVTYGQWVPETRVVQRPKRTLRMEPKEEVTRVVVRPTPSRPAAAGSQSRTAAQPRRFGGLHRLESDPPRFGRQHPPASDSFLR